MQIALKPVIDHQPHFAALSHQNQRRLLRLAAFAVQPAREIEPTPKNTVLMPLLEEAFPFGLKSQEGAAWFKVLAQSQHLAPTESNPQKSLRDIIEELSKETQTLVFIPWHGGHLLGLWQMHTPTESAFTDFWNFCNGTFITAKLETPAA